MMKSPLLLLGLSLILMLVGIILPFLMVVHIIKSTFFLNFLAYIASTVGLFMGIVGMVMNMRMRK